MASKQLKKFSRVELVDIIYELQKQNEEYAAQIEELESKAGSGSANIEGSDSVADTSAQITSILQAAQEAADKYLQSVKDANSQAGNVVSLQSESAASIAAEEELVAAKEEAAQLAAEAQKKLDAANVKAEHIIANAHKKADTILEQAAARAEDILRATEREATNILTDTVQQANDIAADVIAKANKEEAILQGYENIGKHSKGKAQDSIIHDDDSAQNATSLQNEIDKAQLELKQKELELKQKQKEKERQEKNERIEISAKEIRARVLKQLGKAE